MEYPKFQFSLFDGEDGQYVVRTEDEDEFKQMVAKVRLAVLARHPQASKPEPTYEKVESEKPKVPYMWENDVCPICHQGNMTKTVKQSKTGEKYNALICDQPNCKGYAYISKYPKI